MWCAGNRDDIKRGFQEVRDQLGHPSVLIYNAGPTLAWPPPGIMDVTPEILEKAMGPGMYGALYCAQEVCGRNLLVCTSLSVAWESVRFC